MAMLFALMALGYNMAGLHKKYTLANYIVSFFLGAISMMIVAKILEKVS